MVLINEPAAALTAHGTSREKVRGMRPTEGAHGVYCPRSCRMWESALAGSASPAWRC